MQERASTTQDTSINIASIDSIVISVQGWGLLKLRSLISPLAKFSILQK